MVVTIGGCAAIPAIVTIGAIGAITAS